MPTAGDHPHQQHGATDPFAALGLPRRFDLAPAAVLAAHLRKAAAAHPDRISDPMAQVQAAAEAARINDAKAMLMDDEQRANALLTLLGGPTKEQDKSLPDGFLIAMLQVREQMEAEVEQRPKWEAWAAQQRAAYRQAAQDLFDRAQDDPAALRAIRRQLNAWRYIERMIEQLGNSHVM